MDLGAAASGKGAKKDEVILAVPTEEKDINALYADELKLLAEPIPIIKPTRSATQKQEDYYKVSPRFRAQKALIICRCRRKLIRLLPQTFRTNVLMAWVLSNGALCAGIL